MSISDMCPECNMHMKWIRMRKPAKVRCPECKTVFEEILEGIISI